MPSPAQAKAGPGKSPARVEARPGKSPARAKAGPVPGHRIEVRRYLQLPFTFHHVHGANIRITGAHTVAVRKTGYKDGLAFISQSLRRGQHFRFRVDKLAGEWSGGVVIGAVGSLPAETVPETAQLLQPPAWLASCDLIADNGCFTNSNLAACLEDLGEGSVLCLHFCFNSKLVLEVNGKILGTIAVVPNDLPQIHPFIDLYGKVYQVSVLLHPYVVAGGAVVKLPFITEVRADEEKAEELDWNYEWPCLDYGHLYRDPYIPLPLDEDLVLAESLGCFIECVEGSHPVRGEDVEDECLDMFQDLTREPEQPEKPNFRDGYRAMSITPPAIPESPGHGRREEKPCATRHRHKFGQSSGPTCFFRGSNPD